jgi:hypothetical protein
MTIILAILIPVIYLAGFIFTARKVTHVINCADERKDYDLESCYAVNRAAGLIAGLIWPLALVTALLYVMTFARMPRTPGQLKAERDDFGRRLAELEAENARLRREQDGPQPGECHDGHHR